MQTNSELESLLQKVGELKGLTIFALGYLNGSHTAEDIYQEVLLDLITGKVVYDPSKNSNLNRWFLLQVKRKAIDQYRHEFGRQRSHRRIQVQFQDLQEERFLDLADPTAEVEFVEEIDKLYNALLNLPSEKEREILKLHYLEAKSCREVAASLGISEGGVYAYLHTGRIHMRELIGEAA